MGSGTAETGTVLYDILMSWTAIVIATPESQPLHALDDKLFLPSFFPLSSKEKL